MRGEEKACKATRIIEGKKEGKRQGWEEKK